MAMMGKLPGFMSLTASRTGRWASGPWQSDSAQFYLAVFTASVVCFSLATVYGPTWGPVGQVFATIGSASCGWSWLLARALFNPKEESRQAWPLALIATMLGLAALLSLVRVWGGPEINHDGFIRIVLNTHSLLSSTVLILALVEIVRLPWRSLVVSERRFRLAFALGYGSLLAVSVIWLMGSTQTGDSLRIICACAAVVGAWIAVSYRRSHPLLAKRTQRRAHSGASSQLDQELAKRLIDAIEGRRLFADPELRVSDLARHLRVPEYKVSRAITGPLGFDNFNQMINSFRIAEAKKLLVDPDRQDQSILSVAMECGFGSIGPFNRAFKQAVGETPSAYRKHHSLDQTRA